jgi:MarR family transcriptional regulator, transcriptional regulator for hemolysin
MICHRTYVGNIWRMAADVERTQERAESTRCFSTNLGWLLKQASYALGTELIAALAPVGVSPRGYHVLAAALTGEHTQTELAQLVGLDKTTMVVTVDELEEAGLAKRLPSSHDRRARVIAVTEAGERKVAEARQVIDRIQEDVLASLPARERTGLLDALNRLVSERLSEPAECSPPLRRREPR